MFADNEMQLSTDREAGEIRRSEDTVARSMSRKHFTLSIGDDERYFQQIKTFELLHTGIIR